MALLDDVEEPLCVLYYGDGGTGKTTDIASMANLGRILLVNAESGIKARPLRARGIDTANIELWPEPGERVTFEGLEELHIDLLRRTKVGAKDRIVGVGWDSVSEIYKTLLEDVVKDQIIRANRAGKERDPFFIDRGDYGIMTEQIRTLVRRYRDLPCHFAMSALSRREQDDDGTVTYQPAITPALQNDLIGWVDMVCVTSVALVEGEDEYRGLFRPHSKYRGKDRMGIIPKWLVDPTFDRLVAYVSGDIAVDTDPIMLEARERAQRVKLASEKKGTTDPADTGSEPNEEKT